MLKQCLKYFKGWILIYIILGFTLQLFNSLGIVFFQRILDHTNSAVNVNDIILLVVIYGLLLIGTTVLNYLNEYPSVFLSNSIVERLKIISLEKISKIDYLAYQEIGTGEMIKVIENGANAGKNIIFSFYLRVMHELLPTIVFSLFFISFYDLRIMFVVAIGYIVIFILTNILLKFLYSIKTSLLKEQEKSSRYSIRGFMELVVFRTSRRYEKEIERLGGIASSIVNKSAQIKMIHESFFAIFAFLISVIKILILYYGIKNVIDGDTSIGIIVALLLFIDKIYTPVAIFNVIYVDYKLNRITFKRFESFINAPEDRNLNNGAQIMNVKGDIEMKNVEFGYGTITVLKNVSLSISSGSTVALVGLSGGGKSTIVKLIIGLLKKQKGQILWDGIDIDEMNLNSLYECITYVSQEAPIFDTSVRGNIVFDNDEISDEEIYGILEKVHLKDKIISLPDKLQTRVGERGIKMSGGERQRLAFARAIAQNRNVIILDEPVSALDNITEKNIMDYMLEITHNKTMIIIAHRLNFIKNIDKIVVVNNGCIISEGNFEYLINHCRHFKELWDKQQNQEMDSPLNLEEGEYKA